MIAKLSPTKERRKRESLSFGNPEGIARPLISHFLRIVQAHFRVKDQFLLLLLLVTHLLYTQRPDQRLWRVIEKLCLPRSPLNNGRGNIKLWQIGIHNIRVAIFQANWPLRYTE